MSDIAFDALSATRNLEAAAARHTFATKADITRLEDKMATKADLAAVKGELTALKWAFGFIAALNVAMAARLFGAI